MYRQPLSGKEVSEGDGDINVNANNNNNTDVASSKRQQKNTKRSPGAYSNRKAKDRKNSQNTAGEHHSDPAGNSKNVLSTLINYKYDADIEDYVAADAGKNPQVPWQERRWDSVMQVAENGNNHGNGLWRKPKEHRRNQYLESEKGMAIKGKNSNLNADVILWVPSSSDDETRSGKGGKFRNVGQNSLTEVDMHQNTDLLGEEHVIDVDKGILEMGKDNYVIPYDPAPPQYPGGVIND